MDSSIYVKEKLITWKKELSLLKVPNEWHSRATRGILEPNGEGFSMSNETQEED